jgi:hypothetical protein
LAAGLDMAPGASATAGPSDVTILKVPQVPVHLGLSGSCQAGEGTG